MIGNGNIQRLKNIQVIEKKITEFYVLRHSSGVKIKLLEKQLKKRKKELMKDEC